MKSRKKKFFITTTAPQTLHFFSGQPRLWSKLFDVTAISNELDGRLNQFGEAENIKVKKIPMHREISFFSDIYCLFLFVCYFIKERPYIVHSNTPKASLLAMIAAKITFRPVRIYMCHGLRYLGARGIMKRVLMVMEKLSCVCANKVIFVSKGIRDVMINDGIVNPQKAFVIGNGSAGGIDISRFDTSVVYEDGRKILNIPQDAFVFTFVGRLVGDKGVNELVQAFDELQHIHYNIYLILVGREELKLDPISNKTKEIIGTNKHIYAVGRQQDVRPYVIAANGLVLPSYREGFGMVLIEAAALGVPSITTNITGCNEIIIPGTNGDIVEPKNKGALYEMMKKWVENPEYVNQLASNSRELAVTRYESEKVWNNYFDFYKEL